MPIAIPCKSVRLAMGVVNLMNSSIYLCMILVTAALHAGILMTHNLAESSKIQCTYSLHVATVATAPLK